MRVMISAVLLAFAIFTVQYRKSVPQATQAASSAKKTSNKPFPSAAPTAQTFAWVPRFPGAQLENINTKQSRDEVSYGFSFHTTQDFGQVLAFYGDQLQKLGFKVELKVDAGTAQKATPETGGQLHADSPDGARSLDIIAAKAASGGEIGVTAVQR